jgi:hypothetical protein
VFGTVTNTYTMPGIGSAGSIAAQTGPLQLVTTDANGNLAARPLSILGLGGVATTGDISRAFTGIATAMAVAGVPTLLPNEKFAMTINWGTFELHNGAAIGGAFKLQKHVQVNASFGYGFQDNIPAGRVGVRLGW